MEALAPWFTALVPFLAAQWIINKICVFMYFSVWFSCRRS